MDVIDGIAIVIILAASVPFGAVIGLILWQIIEEKLDG